MLPATPSATGMRSNTMVSKQLFGKRGHQERFTMSDTQSPLGGNGSALQRELGTWALFALASGAMISSGLFVLPGLAFRTAGPAVVLAYALASVLMLPAMLAKAELATAMPRSGGSYFYITRSLGPLAGTFAGLADWLSVALKASFALVGLGALGAALAPAGMETWVLKLTAAGGLAIFAGLNLFGARHAGRFQVLLVIGLLGLLALYIATGLGYVRASKFEPFLLPEAGYTGVLAAAGMVFVSFGGLTNVVGVAGEATAPGKSIPRAMMLTAVVVGGLYVLAVFVTVGTVDPAVLGAPSLTPLADGASVTLGTAGRVLVDIAAFLAFATTANSGLLSASRAPMGMSREGLIPEALAATSKRFGTPHAALGATTLFVAAVVLLLRVEDLVKTASTMMLLTFVLDNVSVLIMRYSRLENYRPTFHAPLQPFLQLAAIGAYIFLIAEMGTIPLLLAAGFALAAAGWYAAYVRPRLERESALVHLVKRICSRHFPRSGLEGELRAIVLERDQVAHDRFDRLVADAVVLDIAEQIDGREFFRRIAEPLAPRVGMAPDALYELFLHRERESSTVIQPGLAVPHVVVPGDNQFELALVRCRQGAVFSELNEPVTQAFVLVGSADERNYHLRALMHIAHVVEEPGFADRWRAARGPEGLRDVILLSGRKRHAPDTGP